MNEKAELFTKEKQEVKSIDLARNGNKCPLCNTEFQATPPLVPNTTMREFYGGRVKFFKEIDCKCGAKYNLLIERLYNSKIGAEELHVMDMIILKRGKTAEELAEEKIHNEFENGRIPTMQEREEIRKETILANIVDLDTKVKALCMMTKLELQVLCKQKKVKYSDKESKEKIAKKLLAVDPNLVSTD